MTLLSAERFTSKSTPVAAGYDEYIKQDCAHDTKLVL